MIIRVLYWLCILVLALLVDILIGVALYTVGERKTLGIIHRRVGPNIVGFHGLMQAFADALKLVLKENISPSLSNLELFFFAAMIGLIFSLLGFSVIPFAPGTALWNFGLGILYILAVSSMSTFGILLSGWSANSKYAFLGSLRSTAQLISYELILTSAILIVVMIAGSFNLTIIIESQAPVWYIFPLFPVFIIFLLSSIAETNRAPFDLAEAESELVSGFMTEHAAIIFVFFFLAEYSSILLICILITILFLGGYLFSISLIYFIDYILTELTLVYDFELHMYLFIYNKSYLKDYLMLFDSTNLGFFYSITFGIKTSVLAFTFIWVRAAFPRIRFDQLMSFCWTILLPIIIAFVILTPCIMYAFEIIPVNIV